ncbi:MAG TPA: zinc-binding dehydrogenase [Actinospica sp.]|jgi:D-arabinose 1-dehydrogenase-like Zn-dependent alcohol dehydrogenase|nr:zinc-binding dehydrogenase [Actinospica sp.]
MKAAVLREAEGVPEYADFAEPEAGEGLQVVELVAAGLHQLVRSRAHGRHYSSEGGYPLVPGVDAVARTADGELIYTGNVAPPYGTMAERMAVAGGFHIELSEGTEDRAAQVAGGMNPGMSSWLPLKARLAEAGELGTVAIVGATGASGLLAVQNARDLGARRVIAIGRNESALDKARGFGAATARLNQDAIRTALGDDVPNLVLDYVWGAPAELMFGLLTRLPTADADTSYVQIGALAGPNAALPAALLRSRRIRISGSGLGSVSMDTIQRTMPEYVTRIAEGHVEVPVETYPLSDVARAWTVSPKDNARIVLTA